MKPGDLVRINLPEKARSAPGYYYHDHVGLVLSVVNHETQGPPVRTIFVLVDGVERGFSEKYLEAINAG